MLDQLLGLESLDSDIPDMTRLNASVEPKADHVTAVKTTFICAEFAFDFCCKDSPVPKRTNK